MGDGAVPQTKTDSPQSVAASEERAGNVGCGVGLLVAGLLMLANELGWVHGVSWLVPAVVLGLGAHYLYKGLSHR
jgi:hypothetical protein